MASSKLRFVSAETTAHRCRDSTSLDDVQLHLDKQKLSRGLVGKLSLKIHCRAWQHAFAPCRNYCRQQYGICTGCILLDGGFDGVWGNDEVPKIIDNDTLARPFIQEKKLAPSGYHILHAAAAAQPILVLEELF